MPDVTITIRRNGSLKVEGPVRLIDSAGQEMTLSQPIISLCRCGHSRNKPFCDGAHKSCNFDGVEAHIQTAEMALAADAAATEGQNQKCP